MSFLGSLGSIASSVGKVATMAWGVVKTILPILQSLRPAVDEVDQAFAWVEDKIQKGGVEADDFLDRNIHVVEAIEDVSGKGIAVFQQMQTLAIKLRQYSQEFTPDTITPAEGEDIARELLALRTLIASWKDGVDAAVPMLEAAVEAEG